MFLHPTEDYDLLVQLDPTVLPRYLHNINPVDNNLLLKRGKYANKVNEKDTVVVLPGFDPARLLFNDLQVCVVSFFFVKKNEFIVGFYPLPILFCYPLANVC